MLSHHTIDVYCIIFIPYRLSGFMNTRERMFEVVLVEKLPVLFSSQYGRAVMIEIHGMNKSDRNERNCE